MPVAVSDIASAGVAHDFFSPDFRKCVQIIQQVCDFDFFAMRSNYSGNTPASATHKEYSDLFIPKNL